MGRGEGGGGENGTKEASPSGLERDKLFGDSLTRHAMPWHAMAAVEILRQLKTISCNRRPLGRVPGRASIAIRSKIITESVIPGSTGHAAGRRGDEMAWR